MRLLKFLPLLSCVFLLSCEVRTANQEALLPIEQSILNERDSFYYIDFREYRGDLSRLPIGVFDSGTGGLTILDALVRFDAYVNGTDQEQADELPDFANEKFIYLADQANMPYGNYFSESKSDLLKEHVIKDLQFLLAQKYYASDEERPRTDKERVKAIVVACNTATAYGYAEAKSFLEKAGLSIPIIGVINAASRGTLEQFRPDEDGSIGVFATVGTIGSEGYERTLKEVFAEAGHRGKIRIFNQGGHGVAESVDEEPDFINPKAKTPRQDYRGPALDHPEYPIDKALLDIYNFDFDADQMLCDTRDTDACEIMQINSSGNYVRYHLVSLMEKMRKSEGAPPLKVLVLGCTHYPYLLHEIHEVLAELRDYTGQDGSQPYRALISEDVRVLDPADYVARELYDSLRTRQLFNPDGEMGRESEFYISVPNSSNPDVRMDEQGRFTYEYKYGRNEGEIQEYVKVVPFDKENVSQDTLDRLKEMIPKTYEMLTNFHRENPKLKNLSEAKKIP